MSGALDYVDLDDFIADHGGSDILQESYPTIARAISEASRRWDRVCMVDPGHFAQKTETRYFDVEDAAVLRVPDLIAIATSLKTDEDGDRTFEVTWSSTADYYLWPYDGPPYSEIRRDPINGNYYFPVGIRRAEVAGTWGNATHVPEDIRGAVQKLANRLWKRPATPTGIQAKGDAMMGLREEDPDVARLIEYYFDGPVFA